MCGRYSLARDLAEFLREVGLTSDVPEGLLHPRRYNVAPSQPVVGLVADPVPRLEVMEWGFIPSWAKPANDPKPVINARSESIEEKPYFRGAFRSSRCAILADGFYEWRKVGREKHPYRITLADGGVFAMAGLWSWYHQGDGSEQATCAIITTEGNELMREIHDRMPVILNVADLAVWLDPRSVPRDLRSMLGPYPAEEMRAYPVSQRVNSPGNDVAECIESLTQ